MGSDKPRGLVQGTLDMLILKTLALEPRHGFGIGVRIEQISKGVFRVTGGALFPAFRRLERDGCRAPEGTAGQSPRGSLPRSKELGRHLHRSGAGTLTSPIRS
jgi:hypothetical protein